MSQAAAVAWALLGVCLIQLSPAFAAEPKALIHEPVPAPFQRRVEFHIPAGSAIQTLNQFGDQADVQLLFDFELFRRVQTPAIDGEYVAIEALKKMLDRQSYEVQFFNAQTVAISAIRSAPAVVGPPVTPDIVPSRNTSRTVKRETVIEPASSELSQVTVTGTHIRGEAPVGAHLISFSRQDIERTGAPTIASFLKTLPQNFGGGPSEDTATIGREAQSNAGEGTGINLRGLSAGATLVLINGRRLAPSGSEAMFTDISNIPLSAVEHIDFIADGSPALYGADAVGGVVNIELRRNYDGAESQGRYGSIGASSAGEQQFNHIIGGSLGSFRGMALYDFYSRDALPASTRAQATSDLRPFGGDNFNSPYSRPGTIVADGVTYAIPESSDDSMSTTGFVPHTANLSDVFEDADVLYQQKRHSLFTTGRYTFNDNVEMFADTLYSDRRVNGYGSSLRGGLTVSPSNPFFINPTGSDSPVAVLYDFREELGQAAVATEISILSSAVGLDVVLPGGKWKTTGYVAYSREKEHQRTSGHVNAARLRLALDDSDPATAFNPFGIGPRTSEATLEEIRADSLFSSHSDLKLFNVSFSGPLWSLGNGTDIKLAIGFDHRTQQFRSHYDSPELKPVPDYDLERQINAAYAEVLIPAVSPQDAVRWARGLNVSLATRYEKYESFAPVHTPKIGINYEPPWRGLSFRTTWARSFRPPNLSDLVESRNYSTLYLLPDASVPEGAIQALLWGGNNADLREEGARSWTSGVDLDLPQFGGMHAAVTYFDSKFRGRVQDIRLSADLLSNPMFARAVTREPTAAYREDVCRRSTFATDPELCLTAPIGAIIDLRLNNLAMLRTRGIDLVTKWSRNINAGVLTLDFNGTYVLDFSEQAIPSGPIVETRNTENHPLNLRLRSTLGWQYGGLGATLAMNYAGSYKDQASEPDRKVDAWTTWDSQLSYNTMSRLRFALNVENVLNENPPFLNSYVGLGYDAENADILGRIVSVTVRKQW